MTGALYAVARAVLHKLPVDVAGRRVFDETLADWRREAGSASGAVASVLITTRAMWSVARCVALVAVREIRSREGTALLLRLAALSIVSMVVLVATRWNEWGPVAGALVSIASVLGGMPFLAFVCAAAGRRLPSTPPRLGPALAVGAVMFVAMGWVMPASNQAFREAIFALSSTGPIARGINERSIVELVDMIFTGDAQRAAFGLNIRLVFTIAVPVMLVIGTMTRTLTGWSRVAGSVLPLLLLSLPGLVGLNQYGAVAWWPALLAAVFVARTLARGASPNPRSTSNQS